MVRLAIVENLMTCYSYQHVLRHGLVDKMITHEKSYDEARSISTYVFASLNIHLTDCVHICR